MDNLGVNFAPTTDAAMNGPRNGQLSGVPQAIQILSLALPRMAGIHAPTPQPLLKPQGAPGGMDPAGSALLQTLMQALGIHAMGLPGGTAGPKPTTPGMPSPSPIPMPQDQPLPAPGGNVDYTPAIHFQPKPSDGTDGNTSPFRMPIPSGWGGRGKVPAV